MSLIDKTSLFTKIKVNATDFGKTMQTFRQQLFLSSVQ